MSVDCKSFLQLQGHCSLRLQPRPRGPLQDLRRPGAQRLHQRLLRVRRVHRSQQEIYRGPGEMFVTILCTVEKVMVMGGVCAVQNESQASAKDKIHFKE